MSKIYYRCSKCHSKVKKGYDIIGRFGNPLFGGSCSKCKLYVPSYNCQHDYWWELLYIKIKDIIMGVK